jgi:hypothetical protein
MRNLYLPSSVEYMGRPHVYHSCPLVTSLIAERFWRSTRETAKQSNGAFDSAAERAVTALEETWTVGALHWWRGLGSVRRARPGSPPRPAPAAGSGRARCTAASSGRSARLCCAGGVVPAAVTAQPPGVPMPGPAVHLDRDPRNVGNANGHWPTMRASPTVTQPKSPAGRSSRHAGPNPHDLARSHRGTTEIWQ